jgi:hypothetical protein
MNFFQKRKEKKMKKLLLVLMVVAMASFLFVGCIPSPAPDPDPDPDPDPTPTEITATIAVASETPADADGKIFVKGGSKEITVTFDAEVENPVVKVGTVVVPVFTVDNKVFKGTGAFVGNGAVLITVEGVCDEDICAAKSVVVDSIAPVVELKAKAAECDCEDSYALTITTEQLACVGCVTDPDCCKDAGSGLASWNVQIFDADPWKTPAVDPCDPCTEECPPCCSDDPCIDPIAELDGTACPIVITTECIDKVWAEVDGVNKWVTYFDKYYWVIATLTDNVGNKTSYKGIVTPSTDKTKNYVYNFAEIYHPTDKTWCWCYAEDWSAADSILGSCSGTPATACWVEPLDPCPEVTFVPSAPIVGQEVIITIDYTDAVKPVGTVSAYVGPSIKTLPLGIPEDAQELVLTKVGYVYTATYTFGQAGIDYIYVVDGCADCTPCKTGITIAERVCPAITVADAVLFDGDWYIDADEHDITVTFDSPIPIEQVRVFISESLSGSWNNPIVQVEDVELIISTTNNLVYTATFDFSGDCKDYYILVQYGDSCCPVICPAKFIVDGLTPAVTLAAVLVDCSDCDTAEEVWISSDTCAYDTAECPCTSTTTCTDACTEVVDWTLTVYDAQPFKDDGCGVCIPDTCAVVVNTDSGTECPVDLNVFGCVVHGDDAAAIVGTYYVVLEAVDIVGNTLDAYGILTVSTADGITVTFSNISTLDSDCLIN